MDGCCNVVANILQRYVEIIGLDPVRGIAENEIAVAICARDFQGWFIIPGTPQPGYSSVSII